MRLLATRLVAFLVDLTLLGLLTFAIVDLLFKSQVIKPSAIVSMAIVWTWFFFFVFFDWLFAGTPGKLLLGLRLRGRGNGNVTIVKSLARSLLLLIVPLIGPGRILMIPTVSRLGIFAQWSIGIALLSVFPLSIAFSGGQSLPDLLLGIAVFPKRSNANQYPARLNRRDWLLLLIASLLTGVIFASSMAHGSFVLERKPPVPPIELIERSGEAEARISARLWSNLQAGLPDPSDDSLQDVRLSSVVGELPSASKEITAPVACQAAFKAKKNYQILRAQISPETPTFIKTLLFENLIKTSRLYSNRPAFLVLKLSSRESFGFFNIEFSEYYTFCLMDSEGKPADLLVDANASLAIPGSISEPTALILGDLDTYSQVEKVPIWSH